MPQPNSDYFKLTAKDSTLVAHYLASRYKPYNWRLFKLWTQAYAEVNRSPLTKTAQTRRPRKVRPEQIAIPV